MARIPGYIATDTKRLVREIGLGSCFMPVRSPERRIARSGPRPS